GGAVRVRGEMRCSLGTQAGSGSLAPCLDAGIGVGEAPPLDAGYCSAGHLHAAVPGCRLRIADTQQDAERDCVRRRFGSHVLRVLGEPRIEQGAESDGEHGRDFQNNRWHGRASTEYEDTTMAARFKPESKDESTFA